MSSTDTNTDDPDFDVYVVTFAGIVVRVCGTDDEATSYAKDLRRAHPTASIAVEVLV